MRRKEEEQAEMDERGGVEGGEVPSTQPLRVK